MALDLLSVPAQSSEIQRVFSEYVRTVHQWRNLRLTGKSEESAFIEVVNAWHERGRGTG